MKDRAGFTLLEVMIALAVVGGLLVTLLYVLTHHLAVAERHEFLTVASMLAKDKMAETEQSPASGKGDFPAPYSNYHYRTDVKDSPYQGLSELSVVVSDGREEVRFSELIRK